MFGSLIFSSVAVFMSSLAVLSSLALATSIHGSGAPNAQVTGASASAKMNVDRTISLTVIAPANAEHSGCDLSVPGFENRKSFIEFFEKMKTAAGRRDREALKKLVVFPLRVNSRTNQIIRRVEELDRQLPTVFTDVVMSEMAHQDLEKLFCNSQGAMVGDGAVWIKPAGTGAGISSINL